MLQGRARLRRGHNNGAALVQVRDSAPEPSLECPYQLSQHLDKVEREGERDGGIPFHLGPALEV